MRIRTSEAMLTNERISQFAMAIIYLIVLLEQAMVILGDTAMTYVQIGISLIAGILDAIALVCMIVGKVKFERACTIGLSLALFADALAFFMCTRPEYRTMQFMMHSIVAFAILYRYASIEWKFEQ